MLHHGATPDEWTYFADTLGLKKHLLPVVSNPAAAISPMSKMLGLGKTPSVYNRDGNAVGIPKWTEHYASTNDINYWASQSDYGICVQTRQVRAIDIDVPDREKSDLIRKAVFDVLGFELPIRWRSDSGKQLLVYDDPEPNWPKRVQPVDGGIVEFLGDGQQFVAIGRHPDGERYKWGGEQSRRNKPLTIPVVDREKIEEIWTLIGQLYGTAEGKIARQRRRGEHVDLEVHDDVADWLVENWETYDVGLDKQVFIRCPFDAEHTTDSGLSSTAYFPAGTGGYQQGHFVCLHAHCAGRDDSDFKEATGYDLAQFEDLSSSESRSRPDDGSNTVVGDGAASDEGRGADGLADGATLPEDEPWPSLARDKKGRIEVSARNIVAACGHPGMIGLHLAYDSFTDALLCRAEREQPWRRFTDADTIAVRIQLEHRGFGMMGKELLRDSIAAVASKNRMDTAQSWLNGLRWDGVERVRKFAHEIWGWADTPYAEAVSLYVWSALAGRIMHPGVRADMAPILVGLQGTRKTTLIQMMAPDEEMYAEVRLNENDDNISRKLRGKLIGELEELRGLNSRAIEEIKAFITRRKEAWVPKFKEFENFFWRRLLFFGTTNEPEFLADPTGERRWLPGVCGRINVELLLKHREQYWAEGAVLFALEGVMWQDAERLAKAEHRKFKVGDTWERRIEQWLNDDDRLGRDAPLDKGYITIDEVLGAAIGLTPAHQNRGHEMRAQRALVALGFERRIDEEQRAIFTRSTH